MVAINQGDGGVVTCLPGPFGLNQNNPQLSQQHRADDAENEAVGNLSTPPFIPLQVPLQEKMRSFPALHITNVRSKC